MAIRRLITGPGVRRLAYPRNATARWAHLVAGLAVAVALGASCGGGDSAGPVATIAPGGTIQVVSAENFWGSLAAQVGGAHVHVTSIVTNPETDPHDYEATPSDARAVASAQYVVHNGFGYDPWMEKLLASSPSKGRLVLKVQAALGMNADDNPHRWYSPADVRRVIERMAADFKQIDPGDAAFFDQQLTDLEASGLGEYNGAIEQIQQRYAGTPIGATESIVSPLAESLGLKMLTPYSFLQAISQGNDPTAQDKAAVDDQVARKQIAVLIFNTQNATPDVRRLVDAATAKGIPVVGITETLVPADATFQDWQVRQLRSLADALAKATGR